MRKAGYKYWQTGLPEHSEALADLDAFCERMGGITRAEGDRLILLAWSAMQRGKPLIWESAMTQASAPQVTVAPTASVSPKETKPSAKKPVKDVRSSAAADAAIADLDL